MHRNMVGGIAAGEQTGAEDKPIQTAPLLHVTLGLQRLLSKQLSNPTGYDTPNPLRVKYPHLTQEALIKTIYQPGDMKIFTH